jgi:hypothetical protein
VKLLLPLLLGGRFGQAGAKHMVGFRDELFLPVSDLIGMHVKMLSQLGESPVAPNGGYRHLRFKRRGMIAS